MWVKRDDLTSPIYGGNKVRKLERLIPEALARGKKRIITVGAVGSHHVLATAVFAGRGVAPYTHAWRRRFAKEPFATLDRNCYGPFCLLVAAAFVLMVIKRVMT